MSESHQGQSRVGTQTAILTVGIAVVGSNSLVLSPILGDVATALGATPIEVSRAIAAYGGATALSAFLLAPQVDRAGRCWAACSAWWLRRCSRASQVTGSCSPPRRRWLVSEPG